MKLTLLKGGKVHAGAGRDGGKGGGKRKPPRASRPNPLNELLFKATSRIYYKHRATSTEEIANRMASLSKRELGYRVNVRQKDAAYLIFDGRKRRLNYGWMLHNVEKGARGFSRGYVPILVGYSEDKEAWLVEDADLPFVVAGIQSATHTQASMLETTGDGLIFAAAAREALGKPADDIKELGDDVRYLARRMRRLAMTADAL